MRYLEPSGRALSGAHPKTSSGCIPKGPRSPQPHDADNDPNDPPPAGLGRPLAGARVGRAWLVCRRAARVITWRRATMRKRARLPGLSHARQPARQSGDTRLGARCAGATRGPGTPLTWYFRTSRLRAYRSRRRGATSAPEPSIRGRQGMAARCPKRRGPNDPSSRVVSFRGMSALPGGQGIRIVVRRRVDRTPIPHVRGRTTPRAARSPDAAVPPTAREPAVP